MNGTLELPLTIFPAEILQNLGYQPNQMVLRKVRDALMTAMDEARELAHPKALVHTFEVTPSLLALELNDMDIKMTSPSLLAWGAGCRRMTLFALTIGDALEQKVQAHMTQGDEEYAQILDAVRTDALIQLAPLLHEQLMLQGIREGFQITPPYYLDPDHLVSEGAMWVQLLRFLENQALLSLQENGLPDSSQVVVGLFGWMPFAEA